MNIPAALQPYLKTDRITASAAEHRSHAMKILLASSEVHPYSKTGGLADMVGALAKFLARAGHQVGVVTPLYRGHPRKISRTSSRSIGNSICRWARKRVQGDVWITDAEPRSDDLFHRSAGIF